MNTTQNLTQSDISKRKEERRRIRESHEGWVEYCHAINKGNQRPSVIPEEVNNKKLYDLDELQSIYDERVGIIVLRNSFDIPLSQTELYDLDNENKAELINALAQLGLPDAQKMFSYIIFSESFLPSCGSFLYQKWLLELARSGWKDSKYYFINRIENNHCPMPMDENELEKEIKEFKEFSPPTGEELIKWEVKLNSLLGIKKQND